MNTAATAAPSETARSGLVESRETGYCFTEPDFDARKGGSGGAHFASEVGQLMAKRPNLGRTIGSCRSVPNSRAGVWPVRHPALFSQEAHGGDGRVDGHPVQLGQVSIRREGGADG